MIFSRQTFKKAACSLQEKQSCLPLIEQFVAFSKKSYAQGLLALEDEDIPYLQDNFLRYGLQQAVDGIDEKMVKANLCNAISIGHFKGVELLKRMMMTQGILDIIHGLLPKFIGLRLASLLGESFLADFLVKEKANDDARLRELGLAELNRDDEAVLKAPPCSSKGPLAFKQIANLSNWDLQHFFRSIESFHLFILFSKSDAALQKIILANISPAQRLSFMDNLTRYSITSEEYEKTRLKIEQQLGFMVEIGFIELHQGGKNV
jgi:hypothetical protein